MLTKLTIRNFKRFEDVEIELGSPVVFVGSNNSGKTSAMQALALWDIGLKRWNEKRRGKKRSERRRGVPVNRRDLLAVPHPNAALLWRGLHTRNIQRENGRQRTDNIRIDIVVDGVDQDKAWTCGLEFDYANSESFYCRPLRGAGIGKLERLPIPEQAGLTHIAFLPPMSGLAAMETRLDQGAVSVRIGEGRTAEVLRNLCLRVLTNSHENWVLLVKRIRDLFGIELQEPSYVEERGEITMSYKERGSMLDLSSSGRGLQQTLLVLAYMYANPGAVILLDEPDAHLEILRQRQIYGIITKTAAESANQIIAASHSEVLLNEAAGRDLVVAFVGKPHRIGDQKSQIRKALAEIGFDQYHQAEQTGWVLYLEGSTDLAILQAFATRLCHEAAVRALERPFVHYVGNNLKAAANHYHGLREALPDLKGAALFDRLELNPPSDAFLDYLVWNRREIENYLCSESTLLAWARTAAEQASPGPLFTEAEISTRSAAMRSAVVEVAEERKTLGKVSPWSVDVKATDDVLAPIFNGFFRRLSLPNLMGKKKFYELANYVPENEIDPEIGQKLDRIAELAKSATPRADG